VTGIDIGAEVGAVYKILNHKLSEQLGLEPASKYHQSEFIKLEFAGVLPSLI